MKKGLMLALVGVLTLTGCGGGKSTTTNPTTRRLLVVRDDGGNKGIYTTNSVSDVPFGWR